MTPLARPTRRPVAACLAFTFVSGSVAACTFASPIHSTYNEADESQSSSGATSGGASGGGPSGTAPGGCDGAKFVKVDVAALKACGDGKGHCYDKAKVPWIADQFDPCEGNDVCVPDTMLTSGGDTPKSCKSVLGSGGCASLMIKQLKQNEASLGKDVCADGEACAPCIDPRNNNAPTPFCGPFGVYETACAASSAPSGTTPADGGVAPTAPGAVQCCKKPDGSSKGQCISEQAIPAEQRDDAEQLECSGGNKCAPVAFVTNHPVKCEVAYLDGVCMDKCFSTYLEYSAGLLEGDDCPTEESCIPCKFLPDLTPGCEP